MLVRIGSKVYQVSEEDFDSYGYDSYALRVRSKSIKCLYTRMCDEWFSVTNYPTFDASTEVSENQLRMIRSARVLKGE